jgi:hypothetical protein
MCNGISMLQVLSLLLSFCRAVCLGLPNSKSHAKYAASQLFSSLVAFSCATQFLAIENVLHFLFDMHISPKTSVITIIT